MTVLSPTTLPIYLSYHQDNLFQAKIPPYVWSCLFYEIAGTNNQWIYFDKIDSSGKSPGFLFPAFYVYDKFHRT